MLMRDLVTRQHPPLLTKLHCIVLWKEAKGKRRKSKNVCQKIHLMLFKLISYRKALAHIHTVNTCSRTSWQFLILLHPSNLFFFFWMRIGGSDCIQRCEDKRKVAISFIEKCPLILDDAFYTRWATLHKPGSYEEFLVISKMLRCVQKHVRSTIPGADCSWFIQVSALTKVFTLVLELHGKLPSN